ncbi:MAG: lanthionine synthetase LanC family protein, partial [Angustibacter sp.]
MTDPDEVERVARRAADWLVERTREQVARPATERDPSLYHGLAGMLLGLYEAQHHFGDDGYGEVLDRGAAVLSGHVEAEQSASLYFGQAGLAFTLRALGDDAAADLALDRVRETFDGERWNDMFELLVGNA